MNREWSGHYRYVIMQTAAQSINRSWTDKLRTISQQAATARLFGGSMQHASRSRSQSGRTAHARADLPRAVPIICVRDCRPWQDRWTINRSRRGQFRFDRGRRRIASELLSRAILSESYKGCVGLPSVFAVSLAPSTSRRALSWYFIH